MKIVRFLQSDHSQHGLLEGTQVRVIEGDLFGQWKPGEKQYPLSELTLQSPIQPASLLCIGKNYRAHAEEFKSQVPSAPILFIKAVSSVLAPNAPVQLPPPELTYQIDYEAELAVVIGRTGKNIPEEEALQHVLGYTCANDITARDWQHQDGQWARGKSLDTFCPLGPWLETELNADDLKIEGRLNGTVVQAARTSDLIFKIPFLIHYLSKGMTLTPGTVILTGTPSGCGFARTPQLWLKPGDTFEVEIEGIGTLHNPITAA
jgi:2-keto-4-pentenoate hydratase/2-oxohepta-3-ene-1,7-dioic acid hydratase in catechol pathway